MPTHVYRVMSLTRRITQDFHTRTRVSRDEGGRCSGFIVDNSAEYLNAEVILETDKGPQFARVVERARHPDGRKIGSPHRNPMLDTREYFLEFPDQLRERYSANVIAENLYSQCDSEGRRFNVLEEIVDHRITKDALHGDDAYRTLNNGQKVPKRMTKGHQLLLRFRGNETEWMDLQTVKDSNPVEAAEYAVANQLTWLNRRTDENQPAEDRPEANNAADKGTSADPFFLWP